MANDRCSICGLPVDIGILHPDSPAIPSEGEYSVAHAGCAKTENHAANLTEEELADERAWIIVK